MTFKEFFTPNKEKIIISVFVWLIYSNAMFVTPYFLPYTGNILPVIFEEIWLILLSVIMYPFGCAVVTVHNGIRSSAPIKDKGWIILGFVIFLFLTFMMILFVEGWIRVWVSMQ
jgi:hypothetical protein